MLAELERIMAKGALHYRIERDLKLQPNTADYALIVEFDNEEQLRAWNAPSAEHAEMKRLAGDSAEQVMVLAHTV